MANNRVKDSQSAWGAKGREFKSRHPDFITLLNERLAK